MRSAARYINLLNPLALFGHGRTKEILKVNPITNLRRQDAPEVQIGVYRYSADELEQHTLEHVSDCATQLKEGHTVWINVDGLRKTDIEALSEAFGIHPLLAEDILSVGQRPKMDEVEGRLYCLLNMLYYDEDRQTVEQEQVSIILGEGFVITFQEDPARDVFNPVRDKLKMAASRLRQRGADYLCYNLLDLIVDNYFYVMEKLGEQVELVEEEVLRRSDKRSLARITLLRRELIVLKRNIAPVRDLIAGINRSESELLDERTMKYFKDVHDHIVQAYDLSENYRDVMISMQDLYINNVNLKMNEVMKVLAIVTCLLAPATVIGGIFGMNFDIIPTAHEEWGFYTAVGLMLFVPLLMLAVFKRRGWF